MTNEKYLRESLNKSCYEMLYHCKNQLEKAKLAISNIDNDLAEEVINTENFINAMNLKIEKDCEQFLALFTPVAVDLRFIMAILNINTDLERIGDHAYNIAKYATELNKKLPAGLLEVIQFDIMWETIESMFDDITTAYENKDVKKSRKVFKKDKILDKIDKNALRAISKEIKKDTSITEDALLTFSVIKKLERVGDLIKNISEEIIFYVDAKIVKPKRKT